MMKIHRGIVRVYQRDTNAAIGWTQLGTSIFGEDESDQLGNTSSISLNDAGNIIAVSSTNIIVIMVKYVYLNIVVVLGVK